jgi:pimeloyl-ACP methyl ester carboxylesterase
VPFDHINGTYPNHTISIAIVKLPAKVPIDDPRYGGPILLNPGGPGGPGAWFAHRTGASLQTIADSSLDPSATSQSSSAKYFDIIGFDPRGVGDTTPSGDCMPDEPSEWSWTLRLSEEGILDSSDAALGRLWSMTHAFGAYCKQASDTQGGPDIKKYMTTAFVARDMLEIIEKHAAYNAKRVARISKANGRKSSPSVVTTYEPGTAKLQYWGFSYGTQLGSTFASMFPDRVGRLVLDGVVSSDDYKNALDIGSLTDSSKVMDSFYSFCLSSGSEICPLAKDCSNTSEVQRRVQRITKSLYHHPIAANFADGPEIFAYSDLKQILFSSIYAPLRIFEWIGQLLSQIEAGGGGLLDTIVQAGRSRHVYHCPINGSIPETLYSTYVVLAILCADSEDQQHISQKDFAEYWYRLETLAPTAGAIWAMFKMQCTGWSIRASHRYNGPYGGNTSHPILFVSNTADPVTPLRSARLMHTRYPNSGLLIADAAGHCSLAMPMACSMGHIRTYFQTGALPPPATLCVPPPSPFSLNSTDPSSPFYDPSLSPVKLSETPYSEVEQRVLHDAAVELQLFVAGSGAFGFENVSGGERVRNMMKAGAAAGSL